MLFKTITEIKEFMPIGVGNDFDRLKPHIQNAETKYIETLLGTDMYLELPEFYTDTLPIEDPTDVQLAMIELLGKVQHSLINLAYFIGYDFLNVSISDSGFQRIESEHKKGLFKYQEDNLKDYFSDSGFNSLDDILFYLESNIQHFAEYKNSPNWTINLASFIPNVRVLESIPFNVFNSRLTFLALKPYVSFIEDTIIAKVLGADIYAEIKAGMILDEIPAKVSAILPYIRKPLIYLASSMLMEESGATLEYKGLFFEKFNGSSPDNKIKGPSTETRINAMIARNNYIGNSYLDALKTFLISNLASWEDYEGTTGSIYNRDNTEKKTFWA